MNRDLLEAPFAPTQVKQREGNFGQILDYLEGNAVIQRLNEALDGNWSWEVIEHQVKEECSEVIVLGKLSASGVVKCQFGSSKITRNRQTGEMVSLSDDIKAATTDALKKCATLLGVGLYLYCDRKPETAPTASATGRGTFPTHSAAHPATASRPAAGNNAQGRLTQKQHALIVKLSAEAGMTRDSLNRHCQQIYGRVVDFLTRADASQLIEALFAGNIKAA
jgi:hypothetical protein